MCIEREKCKVGQNHTFLGVYKVYIQIFLQEKHYTCVQSFTVRISGSGQP